MKSDKKIFTLARLDALEVEKRHEMSTKSHTPSNLILEKEVMNVPAARHRPLLSQSLSAEKNTSNSLPLSLLTLDTNISSYTVEDTLTVNRHEISRSTCHVLSTHSDGLDKCRALESKDYRVAYQDSKRPRGYAIKEQKKVDACKADTLMGIPDSKAFDSIEVSSGKPRRRSATLRKGNTAVTDCEKGANLKVITPDTFSITSYRRDGEKCLTPSVSLDLPSPNMSATHTNPTLMIPYNKLRLLSSSVDSSISSIDTCRKENNLYEEEFEQIFEMTREQWNALPSWQQARKKKLVGLF